MRNKKILILGWLFVYSFFAGQQGIAHERYDGHRADTSGDGSDVRTFGGYFLEENISIESET